MKKIIFTFLEHVQATKNLSSKSISAYKSDLLQFLAYQRNLLKPDICKYIEHLNKDRKLKSSSIRRKIITLKNFYSFLDNQGIIKHSPFLGLHFKFRQEKKLPKTLSIKEIQKLLYCFNQSPEALSPFKRRLWIRDRALIELLISTGIRIGEAAAITLSDIILSEHTILIHGKGRKQRLIYISSPITWDCLTALIKERKRNNGNFLFVNKNGEQISTHGIEDIYAKYAKTAKINESSTPHYLRHTFATNLLANGADLRSVQEILGHASVATTQIYTEVTTNRKKQVLKKYNYRNKL